MAEQIISPSVLLREADLTSLPQAIQEIDAVFLSPAEKGRYFIPETVNSFREFVEKFGENRKTNYLGYAVERYIRENGSATVISVGSIETYTSKIWKIELTIGLDTLVFALLAPTTLGLAPDAPTLTAITADGAGDVTLAFGATSYKVSFIEGDENFIGNYKNPTSNKDLFYTLYVPDFTSIKDVAGFNDITIDETTLTTEFDFDTVADTVFSAYKHASSPWVISQKINEDGDYEKLFRFHTLQDGDLANKSYKIEVNGIRTAKEANFNFPTFPTFNVVVRRYSDRETAPSVLETFNNVDLNPDSPRYIARVVGDVNLRYDNEAGTLIEDGLYDNNSRYVRVEMGSVEDFATELLPLGFENYDTANTFFEGAYMPYYRESDSRHAGGINFDGKFYVDYLHSRLPVNKAQGLKLGTDRKDEVFYVTGEVNSLQSFSPNFSDIFATDFPSEQRRFVFGFFGGSDGLNPALPKNVGTSMVSNNTFGFDFSLSSSNGFLSYERALDILDDKDRFDLSMLVPVGLNLEQHTAPVNLCIDFAEKRGDVYVIFDATPVGGTEGDAVTASRGYDTSYASSFFPWLMISDAGKTVKVPPTTFIPAVFAYNDRIARPWYAPMGLNRGSVQALRPVRWTKKEQRDILVSDNVNPISNVRGQLVLLGNETLQLRDTVLSKINVRRLLIDAKKFVSTVAWRFIGEPNTPQLRATLAGIINNYLSVVQDENGLDTFEVDFSDDLNTSDFVQRGIIRGLIILQPTLATEGVEITFQLTDAGTVFDD